MQLSGRVALVTGAGRGIGRAIALAFAEEGADVVVNYSRSKMGAEDAVDRIRGIGRKSMAVRADVSKANEVERLVACVVRAFGRVDVLVNNAGVMGTTKVVETSDEEWDRVIDNNLRSTFLCSRAVARSMLERKSGRIINIASVAGIMGGVVGAHYAAAKAGVLGLTKAMARELAPHILVNAIAPGPTETDLISELSQETKRRLVELTPLGRMGRPVDIARVAVFLASEDSKFITGQTFVVDGGRVMH